MTTELAPPPAPFTWNPLRRVLFRFAFCYFALLCVPVLAASIPGAGWPVSHYYELWTRLCLLIGKRVLHITHDIATLDTGSGDKLFDWIGLMTTSALALIATVVWSSVDRRKSYPRLWDAMRTLLRYTLGMIMCSYGIIKIFGGQFPRPDLSRLLEPFGDASPMGMLWTFMGSSHAYVVFSGLGETIGAALVLFRRTATLGALILAGVLTNVVMLNFCYDVPVKINSSEYLLMCLVIALPDVSRLADVLVFHRAPSPPPPWRRTFSRRWMRIAHPLVKYAFIGTMAFFTIKQAAAESGVSTTINWRDGIWRVVRFSRNGHELPAIMDDKTRWQRIRFTSADDKLYTRWRTMDGTPGPLYFATSDDKKGMITLTSADSDPTKPESWTLSLTRTDADHFHLDGKIAEDTLAVDLERMVDRDRPLLRRGFHFINEVPFNR